MDSELTVNVQIRSLYTLLVFNFTDFSYVDGLNNYVWKPITWKKTEKTLS